jgi:hypothetical protein
MGTIKGFAVSGSSSTHASTDHARHARLDPHFARPVHARLDPRISSRSRSQLPVRSRSQPGRVANLEAHTDPKMRHRR